ncbi:MAG: PAS domain-containing sensor histidine kinase [Candidatus Hodarchaeota archaeon]
MNIKFLKQKTLFQSLFGIILTIVLLPLAICGFYFLKYGSHLEIESLIIFFPFLLVITIIFTILGAYYISVKIRKPITQFTKSATEIARGNFTHKIEVNSDDEVGRLAKIFNYMTTELRRLDEMNLNKIITEKHKTETIIKNIADGVIVTDPKNKILIMNSVAERWFELIEKEVINYPIENFIKNSELMDLINKVQIHGNHDDYPVEIKLKPKEFIKEVILQAKAAQVVSSDGNLIGIVTIFRDITKEKEIDRMKTELVSMVAHELRSPLTSIAGFSELLLDIGITKEQSREYADIILKESNRLGDLINKFLDISRIESGKSQVNKIPLHIGYIIENILELNMYQAEKKGIKVQFDIPTELPLVQADKEMIEQVILNLFSNAVKYSPNNTSIAMSVKIGEDELIIEVKDEGFGISKQSFPNIFTET